MILRRDILGRKTKLGTIIGISLILAYIGQTLLGVRHPVLPQRLLIHQRDAHGSNPLSGFRISASTKTGCSPTARIGSHLGSIPLVSYRRMPSLMV